ncbi:GGDEF domain-containing protein [Marinobacterium jannaschii]|uniref:GGDEF domain-containing protein n=1 Tax=Marinobacterium jannaschii TaxID=64970 RepID=UPI0004892DDA|nr:diguanylate cyclase [Marinobacterium jannaschii]
MSRDRFTPQETQNQHPATDWNLALLQTLDVGLVVIDDCYRIQFWNGFMENHSGRAPAEVAGRDLFETFPELPQSWLQRKLNAVLLLKTPSYINWEQRPSLFRFKSHRPITGHSAFMYQNVHLIPLPSVCGPAEHVGMLIYDVTDVAVSRRKLEEANGKLEALSRRDALTGLHNRGYWQECLEAEFNRFLRNRRKSSLIMVDIDHFKQINDRLGHPAGDEVISQLARLLHQHARKTDIVGRYGGEEYGVILLDTSARQAEIFAERLRRAAELMLVNYQGTEISFTISLGIAEVETDQQGAAAWLAQADKALYQAKAEGRNRYRVYIE